MIVSILIVAFCFLGIAISLMHSSLIRGSPIVPLQERLRNLKEQVADSIARRWRLLVPYRSVRLDTFMSWCTATPGSGLSCGGSPA